jgi:uncharacterized protein (DUF4415 family)
MSSPSSMETIRLDGVSYQRLPDGTLKPLTSRSNWQRVDAMTEVQVEADAVSDPDALPFTDDEWAGVKLTEPFKTPVTIRLDTDVVDWFKTQGSRYQTRINAVLRRYVEAQRNAG